jgi:hypothetical protein
LQKIVGGLQCVFNVAQNLLKVGNKFLKIIIEISYSRLLNHWCLSFQFLIQKKLEPIIWTWMECRPRELAGDVAHTPGSNK